MESQCEGQIYLDIMDDHGLGQTIHFPSGDKNTLDSIFTSLTSQFQDIYSPGKLSNHDLVSGFLKKNIIPYIKKTLEEGVFISERCLWNC